MFAAREWPPQPRRQAPGPQIDEDLPFQRRLWHVQRVCWVVLTLGLAASVAGAFGSGPLSDGTAGQRDSALWVEYTRLGRVQAQTSELKVHLGPQTQLGDHRRFWISKKFLDGVQIQDVVPRPEMTAGADRVTCSVDAFANEPATVTFHLEPEQIGVLRGEVGLDAPGASPPLRFVEFIYP